MRALADYLSLTAGHDEETLFVLAFLHEEFAVFHLLRLETLSQTVHNLIVELREQRDGFQAFGRKRRDTIQVLDRETFALFQFHFGAVHAEGSA